MKLKNRTNWPSKELRSLLGGIASCVGARRSGLVVKVAPSGRSHGDWSGSARLGLVQLWVPVIKRSCWRSPIERDRAEWRAGELIKLAAHEFQHIRDLDGQFEMGSLKLSYRERPGEIRAFKREASVYDRMVNGFVFRLVRERFIEALVRGNKSTFEN